jgi:hypothetical protein
MVKNPFVGGAEGLGDNGNSGTGAGNPYFRRFTISNIS